MLVSLGASPKKLVLFTCRTEWKFFIIEYKMSDSTQIKVVRKFYRVLFDCHISKLSRKKH